MNQNTKSRRLKYLEENKITSVLSNTKWQRLYDALVEIEWALDFQRKDLSEEEQDENHWDSDIPHIMGRWEEIEWLNIRALVNRPTGALVEPEIVDYTELLIQAIETAGIPYSKHKDGVRIWGYLRSGMNPDWVAK